MKNLSVREFKEECDSLSPKQFIFSSENQVWERIEHTAKLKMVFSVMMIAFNPNVIWLEGSDCHLCLDGVKSIKKSEERSILGEVFTIVCGDLRTAINDVEYTIIVR